jgi:hypothetical protein
MERKFVKKQKLFNQFWIFTLAIVLSFGIVNRVGGQTPLTPGIISYNQTISSGTAPAIFVGTSPTGGDGIYLYQWQQQANCTGAWSDISGAISANYQAGALSQNMCYRRKVTSSIGIAYSTPVTTNSGLVLNYSFDDQQEPTVNLSPIKNLFGTSTYGFGDIVVTPGSTYTVSGKAKVSGTGSWFTGYFYATDWSWANTIQWNSTSYETKTQTFVIPAVAGKIYHFTWYSGVNGSGNSDIEWAQVEQKDHATPFTPGTRASVTINDYSNCGNNGTIDAATSPVWVSTGIKGGAYEFNYGTERIQLPSTQMTTNVPISISAWINSDDITKTQNIISRNGPYFLRIEGSKMRCCIFANSVWSFGNGNTTLLSNTWYHLCMTYDGAYVKGYVNGVEDYSVAKTGALSSFSDFFIGYTPVGGEQAPFDGKIDEVRVYNRALTQPDVANLYNSSAIKITVNSTPFVMAPITGTTTICNGSTTSLSTLFPTGGTITSSNGYRIHTFTSSGNFYSPVANNYEVLVVAGGGGGTSGGGGGGGLIYNPTVALTAASTTLVTVGNGGVGGVANAGAGRTNGANSQFSTLIAIGGGAGGQNDALTAANAGGSGGGGGSTSSTPTNGGLSTSLQGNNGGMVSSTFYPSPYPSAGGGGAGAVGNNPVSANTSGNGGIGLPFSISGSSQFYAGGGGGGTWNNGTHGSGGSGGGGAGAWPNGVAGTANTGGGGGGGCGGGSGSGGAGGSGVVIVRYPDITLGTWSSSNPAVATVNSSGVVTGLSGGTSTITYSYTSGSVVSSVSTLITVYGVFNPGTISANQTLCNNTSPALLVGTTPTGGDGTYTYQWQQQTNCTGAWSDITGAISANYQPDALSQNTCYRRKVTNCCGIAYSTQAALASNLVLHYAFNNQQEPTTNLITNTEINSWSWDGSGQGNIGTRTVQADGSLYISDNTSNTRTYYFFPTFSANTDYTVSVKFKKDAGTPTFRWQIQGVNALGAVVNTYWTNGAQQYAQDITGWQTVSYTFNFTDPTITQCRIWFQDGADYTTYTHSYYLKDPQFEQKNHSTPFVSGTRYTGTVSDFSSNGNNGTIALATTPKWIATGEDGGAYDFNGYNSLIGTPTINLNGNIGWTVSAWVKTSSSSTQSLLSNNNGGPVYNDLKLQNGKITYYHYNGSWLTKQGTSNVADGNWHFLTWVNFANSTMDMYVDGVLEADKVASNLSSPGPVNQIGKNWTTDYFNGSIDDIRIYSTSFTPAEVANLKTSNSITTTVQSLVTVGAIGSNQTICSGISPANLTSTTAGTGSGTISYEWQTDASGSFVTINGAILATYQPPTLTSTTNYKRRTVSTLNGSSCYSAYTTAITITVKAPPTAPTSITGTTTICNGSTTILTASGGSEGSGCKYEWGTGSNVGTNTISGAISASYTTTALAVNTTYWVRRVALTPCSNTTAGVTQLVTINIAPTSPTSISGTTTICSGTTTILTASGGSEGSGCTYEWGTGLVVGLNLISGASSVNYTSTALATNTTYWVRRVGNSPCLITTDGSTQLVTVTPTVGTPVFTLGGTSTRCQSASGVTYGATASNNTSIVYSLDSTTAAFVGNSIVPSTGAVTYAVGWSGTSIITATAYGCNSSSANSTHNVTTTPAMAYVSATTTQTITSTVSLGATNQQIIGIQIVTSNGCNPITLTSLLLNASGTTSVSNISNARVYYTGNSAAFTTNSLFGTVASPTIANYTMNGSQELTTGTNYFWLTYDIGASATVGSVIDAQFVSMVLGGSSKTPTVTNPVGTRTIDGIASTTFTGTGNWADVVRWDNGLPTATKNAIIAGICTVTANCTSKNLTINPTSNLTVNSGKTLSISGQFLIKSTAVGTGSYINNGTVTYGLTPKVERFITANVWHYLSSPIQNAISGNWSGFYLKDYNEATNGFNTPFTSVTIPLTVGKGFAIWSATATTGSTSRTYTGNLNESDYPILLLWSGNAAHGWNLIGNMYTSAISGDINTWTKVNVNNSIYVWNGSNYLTYNGTVGTLTGGIIPASQGFLVQANGAAASVTIQKSKRVHNSQLLYKNALDNNLTLRVSGNNYSDGLVVNFNNEATTNYDVDYDVEKLNGLPEAPQISTLWAGKRLSINVLPELTDYTVMPIAFNCTASGTFTFTAEGISSFNPTLDIRLQDLLTGEIVDLRHQTTYQFTHQYDSTSTTSRFNLLFGRSTTGISENSGNLKIYALDRTIIVENPTLVKLSQIAVYNNLGQLVKSLNSPNTVNKIELDIPVAVGTYFVKTIDMNGKVIVKKVNIL